MRKAFPKTAYFLRQLAVIHGKTDDPLQSPAVRCLRYATNKRLGIRFSSRSARKFAEARISLAEKGPPSLLVVCFYIAGRGGGFEEGQRASVKPAQDYRTRNVSCEGVWSQSALPNEGFL